MYWSEFVPLSWRHNSYDHFLNIKQIFSERKKMLQCIILGTNIEGWIYKNKQRKHLLWLRFQIIQSIH